MDFISRWFMARSIKSVWETFLYKVKNGRNSQMQNQTVNDTYSGIIRSFSIVRLHVSGMRFVKEYELLIKDKSVEASEYSIVYNNTHERIVKNKTYCSLEETIYLLNKCNILSWDGFVGHHPKNVKDGMMFDFYAVINDNKEIKANGSQNFPKHFYDLKDWLYNLLKEKNN